MAASKDFRICYETQPFPPYFMSQKNGSSIRVVGALPDVLKRAVLGVGMTPKFVGFPWKRCLELLEQNKVDGTFPSIYLKSRENIGRYPMTDGGEDRSRSLAKVDYSIFTAKENPVPWNGVFSGKYTPAIGAPLGYVVVQTLKNKHKIKANTQFLALRGLQLVSLGRLDGYVVERIGGERLLRLDKISHKVTALEPPFESHFWHLMISHSFYAENPEIAEAMWDQVGTIRQQHLTQYIKNHLNIN